METRLKEYANRLSEETNVGLIIAIAIVFGTLSILSPSFLTLSNLRVVAMNYVAEGIMALGMTIVIISGGIDLSVGALMPFSAILAGTFFNMQMGMPLAITLTILVSISVGLVNGLMINRLKADSFIITLATMIGVGGMSLILSRGGTISGFPQGFSYLGLGSVIGIPFPLFLFFVFAIVIGILLRRHKYFHQAYYIGTSTEAARLCGIRVERFRLFVYSFNSLLAGVAGLITASRYLSAGPTFGVGIELRVIATVIVGGASLSGGRGSIDRTVLGMIFLALVNSIFIQLGLPTYWKQVVFGVVIIAAVMIERYLRVKRTDAEESWQDFMLTSR